MTGPLFVWPEFYWTRKICSCLHVVNQLNPNQPVKLEISQPAILSSYKVSQCALHCPSEWKISVARFSFGKKSIFVERDWRSWWWPLQPFTTSERIAVIIGFITLGKENVSSTARVAFVFFKKLGLLPTRCRAVWPDWAIFEDLATNFLTKVSPKSFLKNSTLRVKTDVTTFWATLGKKIGLLLFQHLVILMSSYNWSVETLILEEKSTKIGLAKKFQICKKINLYLSFQMWQLACCVVSVIGVVPLHDGLFRLRAILCFNDNRFVCGCIG